MRRRAAVVVGYGVVESCLTVVVGGGCVDIAAIVVHNQRTTLQIATGGRCECQLIACVDVGCGQLTGNNLIFKTGNAYVGGNWIVVGAGHGDGDAAGVGQAVGRGCVACADNLCLASSQVLVGCVTCVKRPGAVCIERQARNSGIHRVGDGRVAVVNVSGCDCAADEGVFISATCGV